MGTFSGACAVNNFIYISKHNATLVVSAMTYSHDLSDPVNFAVRVCAVLTCSSNFTIF